MAQTRAQYNLNDLYNKVARGKELSYKEAKFVKAKYCDLREQCEEVLSKCEQTEAESVSLRDTLKKLESRKISHNQFVEEVFAVNEEVRKRNSRGRRNAGAKLRELIAARMAMSALFFHQARYIIKIKQNTVLTPELLFHMMYLDGNLCSLKTLSEPRTRTRTPDPN